MATIRNVALATGVDPTLPAHLATKNYVDLGLAGKVATSRQILTGTGLTGGGDLTADRTLAVSYGTAAGTAAQGNDTRITGAEQVANKNVASGYAGLDSGTKLAIGQVPTGTTGTTVALGNHSHLLDALSNVAMTSPANLDTLSYNGTAWVNSTRLYNAELLLATEGNDLQLYGDWASSARRDRATATATLGNGLYVVSEIMATHAFTATKLRFYVATAGVVSGSPAVAASIYGGSAGFPLPQLATAPVVSTTFTSTGLKELTLSASAAIVAGERLICLFYLPASAYTTSPQLAATPVGITGLVAPTPTNTWQAQKSASVAPPSTLNTSDGTWSANSATIWWALL